MTFNYKVIVYASNAQGLAELNEDGALPPQVFFHSGHVAQCRQATLLGTTPSPTNGTTPEPEKVTRLRVEPTQQPAPHDPRLTHQLPWNRFVGEVVSLAGKYWISCTWYCVSLILLPVGCIVLLCRRRQWGMRTVALLPVVAAVFLLGYVSNGPGPVVFPTTSQKFIVAIAFVPVLLLLVSFSYWCITKQWRRVRFWLVFSVVTTISLALLILFVSNTGQGPRFPGERYSLDGWYWICFAGAYLTGWVMLSSVPSTLREMWPIARTAPAQMSGHAA